MTAVPTIMPLDPVVTAGRRYFLHMAHCSICKHDIPLCAAGLGLYDAYKQTVLEEGRAARIRNKANAVN